MLPCHECSRATDDDIRRRITAVDTEYVRPQMDASHVVVAGDPRRSSIRPQYRRSADTAASDNCTRPDGWSCCSSPRTPDHAGGAGALMRALPRAI
jgi:hypothetical protein